MQKVKLRVLIQEKYLKLLQAIADESYLYNCVVNNYSELYEDNIFRNPTTSKLINNLVFIAKENITEDDVFVWQEIRRELQEKNIPYVTVIVEPNGSFLLYNNKMDKMQLLNIDNCTGTLEIIEKIEKLNNEIENEEKMEMDI